MLLVLSILIWLDSGSKPSANSVLTVPLNNTKGKKITECHQGSDALNKSQVIWPIKIIGQT